MVIFKGKSCGHTEAKEGHTEEMAQAAVMCLL